jgi:hypothetical protein
VRIRYLNMYEIFRELSMGEIVIIAGHDCEVVA